MSCVLTIFLFYFVISVDSHPQLSEVGLSLEQYEHEIDVQGKWGTFILHCEVHP